MRDGLLTGNVNQSLILARLIGDCPKGINWSVRGGLIMPNVQHQNTRDKVVFLSEHRRQQMASVQRLSPECDGLELLYANDRHPDKLFALKILAWARLSDGSITAMVPWLKNVVPAESLSDPLNGRWAGYRLPESDYLFTEAPQHKISELDAAVEFFGSDNPDNQVIQEIPDTIGTHVIFSADDFQTISLVEVVSWQLFGDGRIEAMIVDEAAVTRTPVLPGDPCLMPASSRADFCYFFQHGIANKLKERDPEAMAAIVMLAED